MHLTASLALAAIVSLASADHDCSDSAPPTYPEATDYNTAFIPFANPPFPSIKSTPSFSISITTEWNVNKKPKYIRSAGMDTGSTGVMIGGGLLGFSDATPLDKSRPGNEYLSSSGRLWSGYWIDADVTFYMKEKDDKGKRKRVVSHIPILAVQESCICFYFKEHGNCPDDQKQNITMWPSDIHYIGVGFGRGSDEQPQALPNKVAFVNVGHIKGEEVEDIHQGYILSQTGVQVGLTQDKVADFKKTKLSVRTGSTAPDWAMADMSIRINDSPYNHGKALFDTGIPQSYVAVYDDIQSHVKTEASQSLKNGPQVLVPGSVVEVLIPDEKNPIANYTVTVTSNPQGMEPPGYVMEKPPAPTSTTGPFINTGRMFYEGFDAMLDSDCGWFGLRQH
ncbi:adhesin aida-i [Colletotrichum karsti]|uniref:Adhesin aida-i n=1 Tax=Colletotrichum karsti TaxID=1095194 RepID=A0A9P6IGR4_9PEZI|nr:adhesin aida-i [Colletotrichum karsti]KAF9880311.1 adhesin aida-i [Colletotrichum karsti]